MNFQEYLKRFGGLRTDKNRSRYPANTNHQAPHKPFLLLSIMDLIAQGKITSPFIEPSFDLVDTWNTYYSNIMPSGSKTSLAYPFSRLKTDGFWKRLPKKGYDSEKEYNISTMNRLREVYYGAEMDEELFKYLHDPETREKLRYVLVKTYFSPEVQPAVLEQGKVNYEAYKYGKQLLADPEGKYLKEETEKSWKARDQGFRKAIVTLYKHRCALCGIRMLTPEGHTVVDAAHIRPWNRSHDDRPSNGLALCRLCHWSFDEGLMSVGREYEVLVSKKVQTEHNLPGHILTLRDRFIFKPEEERFWPSQDNLKWHRHRKFAT